MVEGCDVTGRYGRIGSNGLTQLTGFDTAEKARAHADRLIGEKTAVGYREK